jgi:hypothetical protein
MNNDLHERAWSNFVAIDAREHPQPQPPPWYVGLPWAFGPFLIIAISGILLSALRTAPVFAAIAEPLVGQSLAALEALLALIVIEVSIVVIRFINVLHDAQDGRLDEARLRGWMSRGFYLAFAIALLANVYASISHVELFSPLLPVADLLIATAVGISAPVLALVSGDILGAIVVRAARIRQQAHERHAAEIEQWEASRLLRWRAYRGRFAAKVDNQRISSSDNRVNALPQPTVKLSRRSKLRTDNLTTVDSAWQFKVDNANLTTDKLATDNLTTDKLATDNFEIDNLATDNFEIDNLAVDNLAVLVKKWLVDNPQDAELSNRALAKKIFDNTGVRVSHETVRKLKNG